MSLAAALAEAASDPAATDWLTQLSRYGPIGILAALLIFGLVVPKPTHDDVKADREILRATIESKDATIAAQREQIDAANKRADVSQETAATTLRLLEALGHRRAPPSDGSP